MKFINSLGFAHVLVTLAFIFVRVDAVPKQYEANENRRTTFANESDSSASERTQRLGNLGNLGNLGLTTGYGNSLGGGGYGSYGGVGGYGKQPIDIGGVVLGALIGIGAVLIIPKIAYIFSGHLGGGVPGGNGYYRNTPEVAGISDAMSRFDGFLSKYNIDSSACMQKAVCHYVRSADYHTSAGNADQIESLISTFANNSIVDYMIDGTAIKDAIENAKNPNGRDCESLYPACPLDRQSAIQMVKKFLPLPSQSQK